MVDQLVEEPNEFSLSVQIWSLASYINLYLFNIYLELNQFGPSWISAVSYQYTIYKQWFGNQ